MDSVDLPQPAPVAISLGEAMFRRRSVREFAERSLSWAAVSRLLWAAQGETSDWGGRAVPSAGALYPLEVYLASPAGLHHYRPHGHRLQVVVRTDVRDRLARAALGQDAVRGAGAVVVVTAAVERSAPRYGSRALRYVTLEAGHLAQNVLLAAAGLGLVGVPVGAFDDERVGQAIQRPADEQPLYLVAVGHPRGTHRAG